MDCAATRKTQKADREKLRRDRLNEQFVELGNILDADRPKNDKATILSDTIQLLRDLIAQVSKLKDEYAMLTEESAELTQEKNDMREEKASLKSDIENLKNQYQQCPRTMFPWNAMDHSIVTVPPSYPYPVPVPVPVPSGPIPMQPYPFYANQNLNVITNPCSTFVPYLTPVALVEQQSTQYVPPQIHPSNHSHASDRQNSKSKSARESKVENSEGSNDVTTELKLNTPGSTSKQDLSSGKRKSNEENSSTEGSSSSSSSPHSVQDSSSSSVVESRKVDD